MSIKRSTQGTMDCTQNQGVK